MTHFPYPKEKTATACLEYFRSIENSAEMRLATRELVETGRAFLQIEKGANGLNLRYVSAEDVSPTTFMVSITPVGLNDLGFAPYARGGLL